MSSTSSAYLPELSDSIDQSFANLFPCYSQATFSSLLEGEITDQELTDLGLGDFDVCSASSEGIAPSVASTAATSIFDCNPVLDEPFFFVASGRCHAPSKSDAPPQDQAPALEAQPLQSPPTLQETQPLRSALKRPSGDMSLTKSMLKKARRISFESSCGGKVSQACLPAAPIEPFPPRPGLDMNLVKPKAGPNVLALCGEPRAYQAIANSEQHQPPPLEHPQLSYKPETLSRVDVELASKPKVPQPQLDQGAVVQSNAESGSASAKAATGCLSLLEETGAARSLESSNAAKTYPGLKPTPTKDMKSTASPIAQKSPPQAQSKAVKKAPKADRKRTRYGSEEEKDKINRDRNRLHARNTRLRKKAYEEELKKQVSELVEQRDAAIESQARQVRITQQNKNVRFMVVETYLKLQASEQANPHRWNTLFKEDISMIVPSCQGGSSANEHQVNGVEPLVTTSLGLVKSLRQARSEPFLQISFHCDRRSFLMDGCTTVAKIKVKCSSPNRQDIHFAGDLRTRFCIKTNKIQSGRLLIDFGTTFLSK